MAVDQLDRHQIARQPYLFARIAAGVKDGVNNEIGRDLLDVMRR